MNIDTERKGVSIEAVAHVERVENVFTVAQRGTAFIVQLDGDRDLGAGRVYESALRRLFPRMPIDEINASDVKLLGVLKDVPSFGRGWTEPERDVTPEEIASAERVESVP